MHGGKRPNAGRKPGSATKLNEAARAAAAEGGIMPLDYMLAILRDDQNDAATRMDAAKAAAPYVHARLAAVEHSGSIETSHEAALDALDGTGTDDPA
jgi:hypothetical protein